MTLSFDPLMSPRYVSKRGVGDVESSEAMLNKKPQLLDGTRGCVRECKQLLKHSYIEPLSPSKVKAALCIYPTILLRLRQLCATLPSQLTIGGLEEYGLEV